jgi:DNA-binding response OmpR family regulator
LTQIMVIEDQFSHCEIIQFYLSQDDQYQCTFTHCAEDAYQLIQFNHFDLFLLDIRLPNMNGIELCREIRRNYFAPIIFMSCMDDDDTVIKAIKMGGDDYLVKPFSAQLLLAHIEANLRRYHPDCPDDKVIISKDLKLNYASHTVYKNEEKILLSPTEYQLLSIFMQNKGEFITFEDLYTRVWQQPSLSDIRTLFVHVSSLRRKIEDDPSNPAYILTHQRKGYIFTEGY